MLLLLLLLGHCSSMHSHTHTNTIHNTKQALRIFTLVVGSIAANVLAFLTYGPLRGWGRRINSPAEAYVYGGVKRLAVLVRMVASCAHWTGIWDWYV